MHTPLLRKLVWIASYPRSGNAWVQAFIANLYQQLNGPDSAPFDINKLDRVALSDVTAFRRDRPPQPGNMPRHLQEMARSRPGIQRSLAATSEHSVFVATHNCVTRDQGFATINFEVTLSAIYIVRNPLDVAVSYARHTDNSLDIIISMMGQPDLRADLTDGSAYEVVGSWSQHVASWIAVHHCPVHVIRYEDMLRAPTDVFQRLAAFLRVSATPEQLSGAIEHASFENLKAQEEANGFRENPLDADQFFRAGTAGQWRDVLKREQVMEMVRVHGPMMQRFGYLPPDCGGHPGASLAAALRPSLPTTGEVAPG